MNRGLTSVYILSSTYIIVLENSQFRYCRFFVKITDQKLKTTKQNNRLGKKRLPLERQSHRSLGVNEVPSYHHKPFLHLNFLGWLLKYLKEVDGTTVPCFHSSRASTLIPLKATALIYTFVTSVKCLHVTLGDLIRMAPTDSRAWMLGPYLVGLFEKD